MWRPVGRRGRVAVAVATCALVLLALALGAPRTMADSLGFDAQPLPGSPNAQLGFFKFDADPGQQVDRVLVITNRSDKAKTIRIAPVDALAAVYGGVAYSESDTKPQAVGSWIELSAKSVEVPPASSVEVPFSVAVPSDASSGVHLGGVALWEPAAATTSGSGEEGSNEASTQIIMVTRMVLTVFVTTPGPAVPHVTISGVKPQARPDGMYLLVQIANDGTGPTSGEGAITLPAEGFQQPIDLGDMVPGSSTGYPVRWKSDPAAGDYDAQVQLTYADGAETATWSGKVTVAEADVSELEDRLVPEEQTPAQSGNTPWLMYGIVGGLVVVVLIMAVALLRRRKPGTGAA